MKVLIKSIILVTIFSLHIYASTASKSTLINYNENNLTKIFIEEMVTTEDFSQKELKELFCSVELQKRSLKFYAIPKKVKKKVHLNKKKKKKYKRNYGTWSRYEKKLLNPKRISRGVKFMKKYRKILNRAYKKYGIPPEYITAIIGIESYYGLYTGKYPVFDTLCTLAFEKNRRNKFFKKELKEFLKMVKREGVNPKEIKGSFAGAIGLGQFMPSNFKKLGVDFDGDGRVILSEVPDAIGSIANYFKQSGWKKYMPVATRVSYKGIRFKKHKTGYLHQYERKHLKGIYPKDKKFRYNDKVRLIKLERKKYDELWYGTHNFYVITRYNHSSYYAMAVHQLAQKIKKEL
ncbi:MAG: lytic murein transglycosylase B [Epsilonproteobacteria bacterium]|nr:lytic murein transglycosylase B [Campylobacterota bacterium]